MQNSQISRGSSITRNKRLSNISESSGKIVRRRKKNYLLERSDISEHELRNFIREEVYQQLVSEGFFSALADKAQSVMKSISSGAKEASSKITGKIKDIASRISEETRKKVLEYSNKFKELVAKLIEKFESVKNDPSVTKAKEDFERVKSAWGGEGKIETDDGIKTNLSKIRETLNFLNTVKETIVDLACTPKEAKERTTEKEKDEYIAKGQLSAGGLRSENFSRRRIDALKEEALFMEIDMQIQRLDELDLHNSGHKRQLNEVITIASIYGAYKLVMGVLGGLATAFKVFGFIMKILNCGAAVEKCLTAQRYMEDLRETFLDMTVLNPRILYVIYKAGTISGVVDDKKIKSFEQFKKDEDLVDKIRQGGRMLVTLPLMIDAITTGVGTILSMEQFNNSILSIKTALQAKDVISAAFAPKDAYDIAKSSGGRLVSKTKEQADAEYEKEKKEKSSKGKDEKEGFFGKMKKKFSMA